ncbi:uncharacterized protein LOC135955568 [Calliphora vicina]|uniref:uncharacterized protein LOC135955568 n=1 Tax=Calliphora vicina TaxID=7373 RepID=UPI00325A738F
MNGLMVPKFDYLLNKWSVFQFQLEQFFVANDVADDGKKKAILLTSLTEGSYILLENLLSPTKLDSATATFSLCISAMKTHFKAPSCGFAERFKFYSATKSPCETTNEWAVRVRTLAAQCEFGNILSTVVRDKFIMGLERGPARDKIFLESLSLTFENALEIANNAEYIKNQYEVEVKSENDVNYMRRNNGRGAWQNDQPKQSLQYSRNQPMRIQQREHQRDVQEQQVRQGQLCARGHLKKMCKAKNMNFMEDDVAVTEDSLNLFSMLSEADGPIKVNVSINMNILNKFSKLFDGGLGLFKNSQASLKLKEGTTPRFFRPRPVPLTIREKVETEIDKLLSMGVLEPVDYSDWGTPIVPILKRDGGIRICGDFKVTLNKCIHVEKYPLPRIEEIFSKLHGGEEFTKLDLSMAYQQIELDQDSRKYTTISTSKGLFQYTRLIYGLASAPAIFQKIMDSLLAGLDGVVVFIDDILISAPNRELHVERVERVLRLLSEVGFKLSAEKCEFFCKKIKYLGHIIDKDGLHVDPEKVKSLENLLTTMELSLSRHLWETLQLMGKQKTQ